MTSGKFNNLCVSLSKTWGITVSQALSEMCLKQHKAHSKNQQRRKRERNLLGTGSQNKVQILLLFLLNLYYSSKVRYSLHYVY